MFQLAAALLIISLAAPNYVSVKASSKLSSVLAFAKFIGTGIIIVGGIVRLIKGDGVGLYNYNNSFEQERLSTLGFTQIGLAFYQGLWSYGGYASLPLIAEEVKNPTRTIPLASLIGLTLAALLYLLINVAYLAGKSGIQSRISRICVFSPFEVFVVRSNETSTKGY